MWSKRFYIALFGFAESASFYSVKTVLVFYIYGWLDYNKNQSSILFHTFLTLVGIFPLIGAYFADRWISTFNMIFYLSIVSSIGCIMLMLAAMSNIDHPKLALPNQGPSLFGLLLIALGVGGIRTCGFAFTSDQFKLPKQTKRLGNYRLIINIIVVSGALLSTAIAPIIREFNCKSEDGCFSSVFALSAILMIVATTCFVARQKKYVIKPPAGGIFSSISNSINAKIFRNIIYLYLPLSFFWALFDQQGSCWTLQATRMDGEVSGFYIKPDQMQLSYYLLLMILTPLIKHTIYPLLSLFAIKTPFQKIFIGGLLAAAAFIFAASLEMDLEQLDPILPDSMTTQLRVYNGLNCEVKLNPFPYIFTQKNITIPNLGMYKAYGHLPFYNKELPHTSRFEWTFENIKNVITFNDPHHDEPAPKPTPKPTKKPVPPTPEEFVCENLTTNEPIIMGKALSYFFHQGSADPFEAHVEKPKLSLPIVRPLINAPRQINIELKDSDNYVTEFAPYSTNAITVARGEVTLIAYDLPRRTIMTRSGGVYVLLGHRNRTNTELYDVQVYKTVKPNIIHMVWQLPQYICITVAEILLSSSVEKFSFSEAPQEMHSLLQGSWWLSRAMGNLLAIIIMAIKLFPSQSVEYLFFAVAMVVAIITFRILAFLYKKVDQETSSPANDDNDNQPNQEPGSSAKASTQPHSTGGKDHKSKSEIAHQKSNRSTKSRKSHEKRRESPPLEIPPLMPTNPKPQSRHSKSASKPSSSQSRSNKSSLKATSRSLPAGPSTSTSSRPKASSKSTSRPPPAKSSGHHLKRSPQ